MPDSIVDSYRSSTPLFKSAVDMTEDEKQQLGSKARQRVYDVWTAFFSNTNWSRDFPVELVTAMSELGERCEKLRADFSAHKRG